MTENYVTDHVEHPLDKRRIGFFLLFAFGIAWTLYLVIYLTGGIADSREVISAGT